MKLILLWFHMIRLLRELELQVLPELLGLI